MNLTQKQIDRNFTIMALGIAINSHKGRIAACNPDSQKQKDLKVELFAMIDLRDRLESERAKES